MYSVAVTHSCKEARKTLLVYSNSRDVLDRIRDSVLGLLKAKAVPMEDWGLAPMSEGRELLTDWLTDCLSIDLLFCQR